nr:hypothetical protein [Tanacetum cinerariifolium]
ELVCDNHSDTFSDSKIDDDISVYDDGFEDIEYVEASLLDSEIVSIEEENGVEEENVVQREKEEVDLEDISQVQDVVLQGDVRFFEELLINDSIPSHESFDSNFEEIPSISQPPPEPPNVESFFDLKPDMIAEEISDKLNE